MKTSSKILLGAATLIVAVAVCYRAVNQTPDSNLPLKEQAQIVLENAGCISCHSENPTLPFYANIPGAKDVILQDIEEGYKVFDFTPLYANMEQNKAINEVDLAKLERVIIDGSMPMAKYYLVHWGSSITSDKQQIVLNFIKEHRATHYPNLLAAEEFRNEPIRPIPDFIEHDVQKAALGFELYHNTQLSGDGNISCATCHNIETGGVDNDVFSEGIYGQVGGINAPTVFNACFNFVQFWDGRAATLAEQAAGPPLNPIEMGSTSFDEIAERISRDKDFTKRFLAVYPEGLNQATITDAIAEYEKTLITPNSAFDRYLKGESDALTANEVEGYALFKQNKCATCHAGVNMGGLSYELMGQRANYFANREINQQSGLTDADNGRWAQTGIERDRYRFKTPSLRNIALTWPYYHDGSVASLQEAINMMATYQVGVQLTQNEVNKIAAFLCTLTGEYNNVELTNHNQ